MSKEMLILSSTINTPEVILDPAGIIKLRGKMISENPITFFAPVRKWIVDYFNNPSEITDIEVCLEYINSVGLKLLLDIIDEINQTNLINKKNVIKLDWYYEEYDEDIFDKGIMLSSILKFPFNFVMITGSTLNRDFIQQ